MKQLFKDNFYPRLFINVTVSIVLAIILTTIILFTNFKSMIMDYEYDAKVEQLESIKVQISKLSEVAVKIGNQIYYDINIRTLLFNKEPNIYDLSLATNQLRTYRLTIPYIESIYVYNKFNDYVYVDSNSKFSDLTKEGYEKLSEGFADESASDIIKNFKDHLPFRPIARSYMTSERYPKQVFFYTFFMYTSYTQEENTSGVLINFKSEYLLERPEKNGESEYFIVDTNGIVVSDSSRLNMLKDYSNTSYINQIITNEGQSGYFTDSINGEPYFFVYTQSDQYGWHYVSITKYDSLLEKVNWMQAISAILSIIFVCIGIVIAFVITRILYRPIYAMQVNLKELKHEQRTTTSILKRAYIRELLVSNESKDREYLEKYITKLNISIDFEANLALILIRIDDYISLPEREDTKTLNALKFAIINVYAEACEEYKINGTDMGEGDILLFAGINNYVDIDRFINKLEEARKLINEYFNISFSVIVSSFDKKPEELIVLYNQVMEMTMHRVFYEKGSLIVSDRIKLRQVSEYDYPVYKEKILVEMLMSGKIEEAKEAYNAILSNLHEFPIAIFNMVVARLVVTINNVVSVLRKNSLSNAFKDQDIIFLLHNIETASDLQSEFYNFFDLIKSEIEKKRPGKQGVLIEQIRNIINIRYLDPDFSVDDIADSLNKSLPYISRLYAQYSGVTIKDTVTEMRMTKAIQLLKDTDMSVNEVAIQVGFSSASYFHKAFKKIYGVTPREYQENKNEED